MNIFTVYVVSCTLSTQMDFSVIIIMDKSSVEITEIWEKKRSKEQ